ncbi:SIR2 family protein [Blastococcus sp. SYSU DS0510]
MPDVPGHVFVVPGTLQALLADDILVSSDGGAGIGRHFWPVFGWTEEEGRVRHSNVGYYPPGRRVFLAQDQPGTGGLRRWVVAVGAHSGVPVSWLLDGVREALDTVANDGRGTVVDGRPRRVAMPVMGVGRGGFDGMRGQVIHGLLDEAQRAADESGIDVVLVAARPSDYSACQALRAERHGREFDEAQEAHVQRLARLARHGQLAVFMGAGTGIAAGLPSWDGLLARLAVRVGLPDPTLLKDLGPLDAGELLRRRAQRGGDGSDSGNVLGRYVAEAIAGHERYALSHALLAALDADQVITTNFDRLFERAVLEIRGSQPLVVLPDTDPSEVVAQRGRRSWLLKMHGDVEKPDSIVLDRRSFVRYDAWRRPLGGVLQTTLLTRHLLVVGASMTDDNVIRLIHEVSELAAGDGPARNLGTVLSLGGDGLRTALWDPEFSYVDLGDEDGRMIDAARRLEIFLDRLVMLSTPRTTHLLDPRYRELLPTPRERELAERFVALAEELERLSSEGSGGWREARDALARLGVPSASADS